MSGSGNDLLVAGSGGAVRASVIDRDTYRRTRDTESSPYSFGGEGEFIIDSRVKQKTSPEDEEERSHCSKKKKKKKKNRVECIYYIKV